MIRRQWGGACLAALCAAACGGRAETEAPNAAAGTPPRGFYSLSWHTVADSCDPARPQGVTHEFAGETESGVLAVLSRSHGHQELRWDEPLFFTASECELAFVLEVTSKSAHSYVVDSQIDWGTPSKSCQPWASLGIPSAACSVHQITTYELEQACPTTQNGVSCQ